MRPRLSTGLRARASWVPGPPWPRGPGGPTDTRLVQLGFPFAASGRGLRPRLSAGLRARALCRAPAPCPARGSAAFPTLPSQSAGACPSFASSRSPACLSLLGAPRFRPFFPVSRIFMTFRSYCTTLGLQAGWHAFRRGRASDMLRSGSSVGDILLAGSWRSGAFLRYLRRAELDTRASVDVSSSAGPGVLEAVFDHSGSD